jgi:hypothetical protein
VEEENEHIAQEMRKIFCEGVKMYRAQQCNAVQCSIDDGEWGKVDFKEKIEFVVVSGGISSWTERALCANLMRGRIAILCFVCEIVIFQQLPRDCDLYVIPLYILPDILLILPTCH